MGKQDVFCAVCDRSENSELRHSRLFRFPADEELKQKWLSALQLNSEDLRCRSRVCAGHFTRDQFVRYRLKPGAIPSKICPEPEQRRLPSKATLTKANAPPKPLTSRIEVVVTLPLGGTDESGPVNALQPLKVDQATLTTLREPVSQSELDLRKELAALKKENYRLKQTNKQLQTKLDNVVDITGVFSQNSLFETIMMDQVKRYSEKRYPYSEFEKSLSLSLFYSCGNTGYLSLLKLGFKFPAVSTIKGWLSHYKFFPGINPQLIDCIKKATENFEEKDKDCCVMWDEMSAKDYLEYNKHDDMLEGIVDYGSLGRNLETANEMLVFMVCGIDMQWKFPVSFYASKNATPTRHLDVLVKENIKVLHEIGLKVRIGICDMGQTNQKLYERWGVTEASPYINYLDRKIYMIHDTPHLVKSVRNNLMKHDYILNSIDENGKPKRDRIKWSHIVTFYNKDRRSLSRAAPKLTNAHINVKDYAKMKVKLAGQVLSFSVYAGMCSFIELGILTVNAQPTADFVRKMDEIFDFLNMSAYERDKPTRQAKFFFQNLTKFDEYINFFKCIEVPTQRECDQQWRRGFILTLSGMKQLALDLRNEGYKCLYTRRIQQDPLEHHFSGMRGKGGFCRNPTSIQFRRNFRYLFFVRLMVISPGSNCEQSGYDCFKVRVANIDKCLSFGPSVSFDSEEEIVDMNTYSCEPAACSTFFEIKLNRKLKLLDEQEQIVAFYLGGYSVKAILDSKMCEICTSKLVSSPGEMKQELLVKLKDFDERMTYISEYCFQFFRAVNKVFGKVIVEALDTSGTEIAFRIFARLTQEDFVKEWISAVHKDCVEHRAQMLHYFIRAKIFRLVKDKNDSVKQARSWDQTRRDLRSQ